MSDDKLIGNVSSKTLVGLRQWTFGESLKSIVMMKVQLCVNCTPAFIPDHDDTSFAIMCHTDNEFVELI